VRLCEPSTRIGKLIGDLIEKQTLKIFNVRDLKMWGVWPELDALGPQILFESDNGLFAASCCFGIIRAELAGEPNQDGQTVEF